MKSVTKEALIGSSIGDALGVPVEFMERDEIRALNVKDMLGCDTFHPNSRWGNMIPRGSWSDDTSMTIAVMDAIITDKGKICDKTIMDNFVKWWYNGEYTSIDKPFGLGGVIHEALHNYHITNDPSNSGCGEERDNGNGSLMRILPHSLYAIYTNKSEEEINDFIAHASSLTHAHGISKMSCFIYTLFLKSIINTKDKNKSFDYICNYDYSKYYDFEIIEKFNDILTKDFLKIKDIESKKNGYVVATLEAVLFSIMNNNDFESTLLCSINLGYDTDTIGAITGSIAGDLYGYDSIPKRWLDVLKRKDYLFDLASSFDLVLNDFDLD